MNRFYRGLYRFVILPVLWGGFRISGIFFTKGRAGIRGRQALIRRVVQARDAAGSRKVVLLHCASAGELESLKPIVDALKPAGYFIAVSYFSPSAMHAARKYPGFDFADFSPLDAIPGVNAYLNALKPDLIAITKHDVWPNFVWTAQLRRIPVVLINANFPKDSLRLHGMFRGFHRAVYSSLNRILCVSAEDAKRIGEVVSSQVSISATGDSRFDQVVARVARKNALPSELESYCAGGATIIAGSTHRRDEDLLFGAMPRLRERFPDLRWVIVPHDPSTQARSRIMSAAQNSGIPICEFTEHDLDMNCNLILVNRKGILADMFRLGSLAYIGGAFGKGVHSVIEPMAAGLPVICGPRIGVSHEARRAHDLGLLHVVCSVDDVVNSLSQWLSQSDRLIELRSQVRQFVAQQSGAAPLIANQLREFLDS